MLRLAINQIIFLSILSLQLFCKNKYDKKTYESKVSYFFVVLYGLLFFYEIRYGNATIMGDIFAIDITLFFILGFIFSLAKCMILVIFMLILLYFNKHLYGVFLPSLYIDVAAAIINIFFGKLCKSTIHKDSTPHTFYAISYSFILASIYGVVALITYIVNVENGVYVFSYLPKELLIRIVIGMVVIGSAFFVFKTFGEKDKKSDKNLINIFIKKYNHTIIGFIIFAILFTYFFIFIYINYNYGLSLKFNFDIAKDELTKSYVKYGERCLEKDPSTKDVFDAWTLELAGGVYVLDENFKAVNTFDNVTDIEFLNSKELDADNFRDIEKYDINKVFVYNHDGMRYLLVYDHIAGYYLVAFFAYDRLIKYAFIPTCFTIFVMIFNILVVFMLVYNLFKDFVLSRLWKVNEKLSYIAKGNYDVVLTDNSSTEFSELSESINKTVDTLKSNIDEIERKNKDELILARRIQMSQLPINTDITIGYSGYGINIPAEDVGGDFFDDFAIDDHRRVVLVADVSGKGIPGALFMMKAKHTIINLAKQYDSMEMIFEEVNRVLSDNNPSVMFVTCFAIMIDILDGKICMINAGHNLPAIMKKSKDGFECSYIDIKPSHILGIDKDSKYVSKTMTLEKGDTIILYTDGVTEAMNGDREQYGSTRLLNTLKNMNDYSPKDMCEKIVDDVRTYVGTTPQSDDITLYCLRYNGGDNVLSLKSDSSAIDKGKAFVDKFTRAYGIDKDISRNLKVVYDEIACNIIKYAYKESVGDFTFKLNLLDDRTVEMIFIDSGDMFDPTAYDSDIKKKSVDDKISGGMGIMFCKNMMDRCVYVREDEKNVFKMYKKV